MGKMSILKYLLTFAIFVSGVQANTIVKHSSCNEGQGFWAMSGGPSVYHHYSFKTTQNVEVVSRNKQQSDHQGAIIQGLLVLKKRTEIKCSLEISFHNVSITYPSGKDVENKSNSSWVEEALDLGAPVFYTLNNSSFSLINIPGDEETWKNNIRISLLSSLIFDNDAKPIYDNVQSKVVNWDGLHTSKFLLIKRRKQKLQMDNLKLQENISDKEYHKYIGDFNLNLLRKEGGYGFQSCFFNASTSNQITDVTCDEEQVVVGGSQMLTNTTTSTIFSLIKIESNLPDNYVNLDENELNSQRNFNFDPITTKPSKNLKVKEHFFQEISKICSLFTIKETRNKLSFMETFRKIVPLVPANNLREAFIQIKDQCENGIKLFLELVAISPSSDAVIEFMSETFLSGEDMELNTLKTFMSTATRKTSEGPGIIAVRAMTRLLTNQEKHLVRLSEQEMVLYMSSFLSKISPSLRNAEAVEEYLTGLHVLLQFSQKVDRNTRLETERAVNIFTGNNKCESSKNDFDNLKCLDNCDEKNYIGYIQQLYNKTSKSEDLKIISYLQMSKCPKLEMQFRDYIRSDEGNEEVSKFIRYHTWKTFGEFEGEIPEASQLGRTFVIENVNKQELSEYGTTDYKALTSLEINFVMGSNNLPRFVTLELTQDSIYGKETFYEIELMRSEISSNEGQFDVFLTQRENKVPIRTLTIPIDVAKYQTIFQDFFKSKDISTIKMQNFVQIFKQKVQKCIDDFLEINNVQKTQTFLLEDTVRMFPTMSGLPIKTEVQLEGVMHLEYKWDMNWVDGEFVSNFEFHPSISWQRIESSSLAYAHNEILGYEVGAHYSANFNFGVEFHTKNDQRTFISRFVFSNPDEKNADSSNFFQSDLKFLHMRRVQYLDSSTRKYESEHLWDVESLGGIEKDASLELGKHFPLLEGGNCVQNLKTISKGLGPLYLSKQTSCTIPAINFKIEPSIRNPSYAYVEYKAYPDNANTSNTYCGKFSILSDRKNSAITLGLEQKTPQNNSKFNVTWATGKTEKSFKVHAVLNQEEYGAEAYIKQKQFDVDKNDLNTTKSLRIRRETHLIENTGSPWSHKQFEFGLRGKYKNFNASLLQGIFAYVDKEFLHLSLNHYGIFTKADSKLFLSLSTKHNATKILNLGKENIPVPGSLTLFTLQVENGHFGQFTTKAGFFFANKYNGTDKEISPTRYFSAKNGWINITSKNLEEVEPIWNADYLHYKRITQDFQWVDEISDLNITSPKFPFLDLVLKAGKGYGEEQCIEKLSEICQEGYFNETMSFSLKLKQFPNHEVKFDSFSHIRSLFKPKFENLEYHYKAEASAGSLIYYKGDVQHSVQSNKLLKLVEIGMEFKDFKSTASFALDKAEGISTYLGSNNVTFQGNVYKMDHKLRKSDHNPVINYDGKLSLMEPSGPQLIIEGLYEPIFEQEIYKGSTLIGKLNEKKWTEPILFFFKKMTKPDFSTSYTLYANDSKEVYFDGKIENSKEIFSVDAMTKDSLNLNFTSKMGESEGKLELLPLDLLIKTSLAWPLAGTLKTLKINLNAASIENSRIRHITFESKNELEYLPSSPSINKSFGIFFCLHDNLTNPKFYSRTKLRLKSVSQKITLSGQLYPEENSPTQQFFLEWVLPTADKFVVEIKKQFLVGSLIQEDKNKPSVVIGHWITLEKPGYPPFSTSTTIKAFGSKNFVQKEEKEIEVVQKSFEIEQNISHQDFFVPVETDLYFKGVLNTNQEMDSNLQVLEKAVVLKMSVKADGPLNMPENTLNINYIFKHPETEDVSRELKGRLKTSLLEHEAHWNLHSYIASAGETLDLATNTLDNCLRTVMENGSLYSKHNDLGYGFITKSPKYGNTIFNFDVEHKFKKFYESWKLFDVSATHKIVCPFLTTEWEDKVRNSLDSNLEGTFFIQSSEIFNLTLKKSFEDVTSTLDIIPTPAKTNFKTSFKQCSIPEGREIKWATTCESVFFPSTPLRIFYDSNFNEFRTITKVDYKLPPDYFSYTSGFIERRMNRFFLVNETDKSSAEVVKHRFLFKRSSGEIRMKQILWESSSAVLKDISSPTFIHYSFNGLSQHTSEYVKIHETNGSFSVSGPNKKNWPHLLQVSFSSNQPKTFIGIIRLGKINEDNDTCDRDKIPSNFSFKDEISIEKLKLLQHHKTMCEPCSYFSNQTTPTCHSASGSVFSQSLEQTFKSIWTEEECWAENEMMKGKRKDLSSQCLSTLKKIKKVENICWLDPSHQNCNESMRSKQLTIWNRATTRTVPLVLTTYADALGIVWHLLKL